MNILKKLIRFPVKDLFVCEVLAADNLRYIACRRIGEYDSVWIERSLGFRILYGNSKTLEDPIYNTKYVSNINALYPEKNRYYKNLGNITDVFETTTIGKGKKISLDKIEKLDSILKKKYEEYYNSEIEE